MEEAGLRIARFLPHLARQKMKLSASFATAAWANRHCSPGRTMTPATIDQGHALFDLIARNTHDSRMYIFNHAGHFSYREHPAEFNEMRSFIERNG